MLAESFFNLFIDLLFSKTYTRQMVDPLSEDLDLYSMNTLTLDNS